MLKQGIEFLFIKMRKLLVMVVFLLLEPEDNSYAFASVHEIKTICDPLEGQSVTHKLIYFELLVHILFHQFGNTVNTLIA